MAMVIRIIPKIGAVTLVEPRSFQIRAWQWLVEALGEKVAQSRRQRALRFIEEAIELAQACALSEQDVNAEARKVFCRPAHTIEREVGGVMMTLACLCRERGLDMNQVGEDELSEVWRRIPQIQSKQKGKSL
jgi:NTP pyrophosphatase (non-canonical NTP hydrolase)